MSAHLIVDETNRYAQQEILRSTNPFTFCSRIGKWEYILETAAVPSSFYDNLSLERLEAVIRCMHLSSNSN
jgi:hypothetical protein